MRPSKRETNQIRSVNITRNYTKHAEGSVLIEMGDTKVLCNATVSDSLPRFLRDSDQGWVTAEYAMLPRATHSRTTREATRGKQGGRTLEIQRLIGRSLRAAINLKAIKGYSITIDCDVIQADGGTRTAAITGGYIALYDAVSKMLAKKQINTHPITQAIAAISVGMYKGECVADLDYSEDSCAEVDMNIIMTDSGEFIELQGTGEDKSFNHAQLNEMLSLGQEGISQLHTLQKQALDIA